MPEVISRAAPPSATPDDDAAPPRTGAAQRATQILSAAWRPALLLVLLGFGWWAITAAEVFPAYLVPTPGDVANELVTEREMLARHTWVTTYETVVGFLLAAVIGMLAAVVIVYSPTLEKALYPLILFAQVIPKIAIAPILVVWFGFGPMPKVILAVLIAFFPIVVSGVAGLRSTDPELLDLSATMGASRWKTFRKIRFPNALPHLLSGLKVAVTLAVVGAVVGEFVGADEGLGYVLLLASGNLNSSLLFADLILMSALGVVLFVLVEAAEALLIPWHASRRQGIPLTTS
ncbi:ABC transporter permease [Jiangella mangrovi]|uniref:NitT/TauT family transport system permease protein n=1 Tax=Jiangella mangrovi TaxID=1524084 RepID=A0A7W9GU11_9ACTN|nr:ABC transporter permease [Jiangella mangrovi]MBB5789773.1 NitT/TauT family transport system permease protein [Jiangella mangrovi]